MDQTNIKIKPMLMTIGSNTKQVQKISCVADVGGNLAAKYFLFHEPDGTGHYVWIDTGVTVDPAPAGTWTAHKLTISSGDSGSVIAGKLNTLIGTLSTKFTATVSGKVVTMTCVANGYASPCRDPLDTTKATGFSFKIDTLGFAKVDAGYLDGDIEISGMKAKIKEILAHSEGETPLGEVITGYEKPVLKFSFKEFDAAAVERALVLAGGHTITPEGADAVKLKGWGPTNTGTQNPRVRITLHPVELDANDLSEDVTFWQASISPSSFKFSGTDFSTIPVEASIYPDKTKPKALQFFAIGDVTASGF